jgi:two-component system, NtrC family, sensor histidine kinase GlrK
MAYPRSFLGLCLASFMLVAAPLIAALAYSAWHSERLAEQSRHAVFSASQAARPSRAAMPCSARRRRRAPAARW